MTFLSFPGTVLNLTIYVSIHCDVSIGKIKTLKPFISISSNWVILLILMPKFQILHFPGPEMARLLKNCSQSFGFFQKKKFFKN